MKRKFICTMLLSMSLCFIGGCGNNKADTTQMDEQISSLIKNMGEEVISLDETKNSDFIVEEETDEAEELEVIYDENGNVIENKTEKVVTPIPWEQIEVDLDDPDLLTSLEKLPNIPGYKFGFVSLAEEAPFPEEEIEYLGHSWVPIKVSSPKDIYGDACSLYLSNIWEYDGESASKYNEDYLSLLAETINYFGEPIYSFNSNVVDLDNLLESGPLVYMFKTPKYYLITQIEDSEKADKLLITYYFLSTEIPHSEKNEKALINFIREHDKDFNIKVYYETSEGNFVL